MTCILQRQHALKAKHSLPQECTCFSSFAGGTHAQRQTLGSWIEQLEIIICAVLKESKNIYSIHALIITACRWSSSYDKRRMSRSSYWSNSLQPSPHFIHHRLLLLCLLPHESQQKCVVLSAETVLRQLSSIWGCICWEENVDARPAWAVIPQAPTCTKICPLT